MHIERVNKGMHVFDLNHNDVGVVEDFKFGDQEADTSEGQNDLLASQPHESRRIIAAPIEGFPLVLGGQGAEHLDLASLPTEQADRLLRTGYIKVKAGHIRHSHRFYATNEIVDVNDDGVYLNLVTTD